MTPVVETTKRDIPMIDLEDFARIIHEISQVFNQSNANNTMFNIFWHPDDEDLMGFNRNRLIFLNLAHYTSKCRSDSCRLSKVLTCIIHESSRANWYGIQEMVCEHEL
jgi:hypothetical protein